MITFTNNYISTRKKLFPGVIVLYQILVTTSGDAIRPIMAKFENLTAEDVNTYSDFLKLGGYDKNLSMKNMSFSNVNVLKPQTFILNASSTNFIFTSGNFHI